LNNLKEFERPHSVFKPQIMVYRHPIIINGLQGTGKSLTAKAIASDWQLPLLKLDVGKLFGGGSQNHAVK
jgi:SpoVK/Ycf46/Vps4 family AAA+-type ATPase